MSDLPQNANYAPEKCHWCRGNGRGRSPYKDKNPSPSGGDLCHVCNGYGSVPVMQPARECALCKGKGLKDPNAQPELPCDACKGSGWAYHWKTT